MTTVFALSFLLVVFHVFFVVVVASQSGSGAVSSDERRFLLRNARLALLDGQTLVGPPLDLNNGMQNLVEQCKKKDDAR